MPKRGGLVQYTQTQPPEVVDGHQVPALLEILDLAKDTPWNESRFICADPKFRYYCGDADVEIYLTMPMSLKRAGHLLEN